MSIQIYLLHAPMMRLVLLSVCFVLLITGEGACVDTGNLTSSSVTPKSRLHHHLDTLWLLQSLIGILGTLLNSFLAYVFYHERQAFATSVNVMLV